MLGWSFVVFYRVLGARILLWHLTAFALRYAGALAFWMLMRLIWPAARGLALTAAALFVVYPGFLQQPDALTYITHLTAMVGCLLSLVLMVWGLRQRFWLRVPALGASLLLAAAYIFLLEYMAGMELVRLLLLWQISVESKGDARLRALRRFLPYLAPPLVYLIWRVFFFVNKRPTTDLSALLMPYRTDPLGHLGAVLADWLRGVVDIIAGAWAVPATLLLERMDLPALMFALLLGALAAVVFVLGVRGLSLEADAGENRRMIWLGLIAVAMTYLPIVLLGRSLSYGIPLLNSGDRYTLQSAPWAALLLAGVLGLAVPWRPAVRQMVAGGLIFLAVATHFAAGWLFAHSWQNTRQYYWQLSWRAPALEPGTLLTGQLPYTAILEGYAIGYPADLIYYPDSYNPQIAGEVLSSGTLPEFLREGTRPIERRTVPQLLNFANTLVAFIPREGACLQVVEGRRPVLPDDADALIRLVAPHSHLSDILTDAEPAVPPASIFGAEPPHGWCYYYQKVSLALQRGEYESAAGLADQARAGGFAAGDPSEWLPFAEAYVYTGQYAKAGPLLQLIAADRALAHQVCELLESNAFVPDVPSRAAHADFLYKSLCQP